MMEYTKLIKFIMVIFFTTVLVSCGGGESSDADPTAVEEATKPSTPPAPNPDFSTIINQETTQADPTTTTPIVFRVVFGRTIDASTFTTADITQNGTATGIVWDIQQLGTGLAYHLRATTVATEGTVVPSIAAGAVQDSTGANNLASTPIDDSVFFDAQLAVIINQKSAQADPTDTFPIEYDIAFTAPIDPATFTTADITQNGTATGVTWNIINLGDNQNFTLQATAATSGGTITPSISAGLVGTPIPVELNLASTSTDNEVTFFNTFDVTIDQKLAQLDPTANFNIEFDVVFSEAIDNLTFDASDITNAGTATGIAWNIINSGDDTNFTLQATGGVGEGTIIPQINASLVQTATLKNNNASTNLTDGEVTWRTTFDVTVNQTVAQADPADSLPIEFDVVFSEAIDNTTFTTADITQNGTAPGITWNIINSGDDINFTLQATGATGIGTVVPSIATTLVQTVDGANNNASTSTDNSVVYAPTYTVTIEQKVAQNDPAATLPIEFDVVFSQAIDPTTFTIADITQNGTATGITWNIINSGDNINFTLQAIAIVGEGTVIPSMAQNVTQDLIGAYNLASTSVDNSVLYRTTFTVTINQKGAQADPTGLLPIEYDVVFSEAIDPTTFVAGDITDGGSAGGVTWNIINSGDNINFTLQATAAGGTGTIIPDLAVSTVQTTDGANNLASTSTDNTVTYNGSIEVTINQKGAQPDPTAATPVEYDVVFSEAIDPLTFTGADITQTGTATGITWSIVNSGDNINFTVRATVITGDGTVIPVINNNKVQTPGGKINNPSTSTDNQVTYNTTFEVTIDQKGAQADPTGNVPVEFDVVFSEAINPATFTPADIVHGGTATNPQWNIINSGDNINFTLQMTLADTSGTVIPSINATQIQTTYGANNNASTSTDNSVLYAPPFDVTVEQAAAQTDPAATFNIEFDVVFSEPIDPSTFTTADITQNGTATAVTWNIINSGDDTNFTLQATGAGTEGTIQPSINPSIISTFAGGLNTASSSSDNSVLYRTTFNVTVDQKGAQTDPAATFNIEFDVVFSEAIDNTTFTTADIVQNGTATGITWNIINSGDDTNFTLQATGASTEGTIIPSINATTVATTDGANNNASTATDNSVLYRTTFTVTVNQAGAQVDPTNALPVEFDVVFSEAIDAATFTVADITQNGTASVTTWTITDSGDQTNFTLRATVLSTSGTVIPSIAISIVQTTDGANNLASTSTDNSVTYTPPFDVTINQKGAQADPTAATPVEFDVVFSEAISAGTFTAGDVVQNGTATGITWSIINSGDDINFTLRATAITGDGTVIPSLNALTVQTALGGQNNASTSTDNSVTYKTKIDVTVDQKGAQGDPTASLPVEFDVVFSEAIDNATFTTADITQNGTATGITWAIINSGDDINYTLRATAVVGEGTVIPSIANAIVSTSYGATNNISTSTDNSVLYRTVFDVTIDQKGAQADPTTGLPIEFDVVFSEAVSAATFTAADITQNGTATVTTWTVTDSGDQTNFTVRATVVSTSGTVIPSINASAVQTTDGANNNASTSTDNSVLYTPPFTATVNQKGAQADPTASLPIEFDVVFGEAIDNTTFTVGDITQSGSATGITWAIINSGDDINFTLRATAVSGEGTLIPSIAVGLVQTTLGGANSASTSTDNSVLYNTSFDVTVNQKGAQADPTSSFPVEFDVVFTEAIDPATFTTADIVHSGTAPGVTWNIINSGDDTNFTLQATNSSNEGTIIPSINATTIATTYGANNTASTSTDNTVTLTYKFDVTINQKGAQPDPTANTPIEWDVVFAQAIDPATFTTADITQNGTAGGITWNIINSGDNINFTLQATAVGTEGTLIPSLANAVVTDGGPKSNNPSTSTDNTVTYDLTRTVTLTLTGGNSIVANGVTTTQLTANVKNVEGQNVSGDSVTLSIPTNGGTDNGPIVSDASGNAVFTLTSSTIANTYNGYTATANGDVSAALNGVIFIAGPPASITLTLTGNTDIAADGVATTTFTANVKDAFSNNCPSASVTLNIPANGGTTANPATTDANGDAFFTLTSSTIVGAYNYDATVNAITSTPQIGLNFRTAELSWDITFWDAGTTAGIVTQTFTLTNDGLMTSGALTVTVSGNAKHLTLVVANDNCNGVTLAPSASCTVEVEWDGSKNPSGLDTQTLTGSGTPGGAPTATVQGTKP